MQIFFLFDSSCNLICFTRCLTKQPSGGGAMPWKFFICMLHQAQMVLFFQYVAMVKTQSVNMQFLLNLKFVRLYFYHVEKFILSFEGENYS